MEVHLYAWTITAIVMVAILIIDVLIIGRRPHEPSMKEAGLFVGIYVTWRCSSASGSHLRAVRRRVLCRLDHRYSLSIDNLFIFLVIMTKLKVPRQLQAALLVGIILALIFRGIFIAWALRPSIVQLDLLPLRGSSSGPREALPRLSQARGH